MVNGTTLSLNSSSTACLVIDVPSNRLILFAFSLNPWRAEIARRLVRAVPSLVSLRSQISHLLGVFGLLFRVGLVLLLHPRRTTFR